MKTLMRSALLMAGLCGSLLAAAAAGHAAPTETSCANIAGTALPHAKILAADEEMTDSVKACRISVSSNPVADSDIRIEVWIPLAGAWNGKYVQIGNGGFAGKIPSDQLKALAAQGYATAGDDDGHEAGNADATWALNHPEKFVDYSWRGLHETTNIAKALLTAQKGGASFKSYFQGCSGGGREALMEAQRFPDAFDGIVAGAPGNYQVRLVMERAGFYQVILQPGGYLEAPQLNLIQNAVLEQCGDKDAGFVRDPEACHFDPAKLACKNGQSGDCLTPPQVASMHVLYDGWHDPRTGKEMFPGLSPGAEAQPSWKAQIFGQSPQKIPDTAYAYQYAASFLRDVVYADPSYDITKLDMGAGAQKAVDYAAPIMESGDPDLNAFRKHGGKLIQYQGWNDQNIPSRSSIVYYSGVVKAVKNSSQFYRLYMIPGMMHCGGGVGPSEVDWLGLLDTWVTKHKAPGNLVATQGKARAARGEGVAPVVPHPAQSQLLCPYPQKAVLKGGDSSVAGSYQCKAPKA